jgi:thiamine-monophosphate kinase
MTRRPEFQLIAELFAPLTRGAKGAMGLKDDAALVTPSPGHDLVTTTDTLISGVHFRPDDPPDTIAQKALRVNLSDLAAKGAKPIGVLQALTLGSATDEQFLTAYASGLGRDLEQFDVPLLGGDTTSAPPGAPFAVTITAFGEVPAGTALLRSGAKPGDLLCASGTLGDGAIGLQLLNGAPWPVSDEHRAALIGRYRLPEPRLALGRALRGLATACLDISDGLCADVAHICETSQVSAEVHRRLLPVSRAAQRRVADNPSLLFSVLGGGDDYELAFTIPRAARAQLFVLEQETGTPIAVIGHMTEGAGTYRVQVIGDDGREIEVPSPGYVHH